MQTIRYTYVTGHSFVLLHQSFVFLVNLEHFTDAISRSLRLVRTNRQPVITFCTECIGKNQWSDTLVGEL